MNELISLEKRLEESAAERKSRLLRRPQVGFPGELPITAKRHEIIRTIRAHQVVIISGETGCGKSTQIPKMCLEAGRGIAGKIACTQPRRIAAITIANRIAQELGETLGRSVGYKIRFQDKTAREAYIKIMTDGMLLAETQADHGLFEYDTIIIDEAHERSLNIDFLLGIIRMLLAARPELKVVITSATLDTEKFSQAFLNASVIKVGGRMYPVEVEYMPPVSFSEKSDEIDYLDMAARAVERLKPRRQPGDILIFMPTEQDILETCERLERKKYPGTTVLPLYARLPAAEQGRVYSVSGPKIVVATNVAETSLTIPGIRYVVDTGLARISQYQPGTRIHSLPISPISRASADQRKGRCGRVQEGLCVRLYSGDDYESRPEFTPPEILRSNLAEVILRMIFLGLGHPSEFPFVDRPHPKNVKDGYETLLELGAVAESRTEKGRKYDLTPLGRRMARMPMDPRLSRMLLEAEKEGCLRETAVIASVLSIRDPRERPPEKAGEADRVQAVFRHPDSDFLTLLNIWDRYYKAKELNSQGRRKRFCQDHYLSFPRMREWGFVHDQIISILEEQRIPVGRREETEMTPALYAAVHRSVLSGYLSNIAAHKEKSFYQAAKEREVMIFPGSAIYGKSASWIVAAEVVRTSRLFARTAAKIDPDWLEELGGEQCRYSYSEPRWDENRGEVCAKERIMLYGLEIVSGRDVSYGPVNPEESHEIFIREALVEGRIKEPPAFLKHNLALMKKVSDMEEKLRRRDIMVSEDAMARFYSGRLSGVHDFRTLERRIRLKGSDDFLKMTEKDLLLFPPDPAEVANYPDELKVGERRLGARYRFAPGKEDDGVTLKIPVALIRGISDEALEWGVPGQFREKILALIKGLPKQHRKLLMPFSETADIIEREMKREMVGSFFNSLAKFVKERFKADIPAAEWSRAEVPLHLRMRIAVTDHEGREIAAGRDLGALRREAGAAYAPEESGEWKKTREKWERTGITTWDFDMLPEGVPVGPFLTAFVGLAPAEKGMEIRLFKTREEARISHEKGVEALLTARFAKDIEFMRRHLVLPEEHERLALYFGGKASVEKGILESLKREVLRKNLRTKAEFEAYVGQVIRALFEKGHALRDITLKILEANQKTRQALQEIEKTAKPGGPIILLCAEIREELKNLVPAGFQNMYPLERLGHFPRYLEALRIRAERGKNDPEKDRAKAGQVRLFVEALNRLSQGPSAVAAKKKAGAAKPSPQPISPAKIRAVEEFRWTVEEFKVAVFAPELKTAFPVSSKRLMQKFREIEGME